jgi:hypothetical protein
LPKEGAPSGGGRGTSKPVGSWPGVATADGSKVGKHAFFPDDDILMFMIVHLKFIYHDLCDFM